MQYREKIRGTVYARYREKKGGTVYTQYGHKMEVRFMQNIL